MNKEIALGYIKSHNLIGIKAGLQRQTFIDIWMVVVEDRIFARSWGLAEKSWYNRFQEEPIGHIKCGENIFSIRATIPKDLTELTEKINTAYLTKYNTGHNIEYAEGIVQENHVNKTLEFIVDDSE